MFSWYQFRARHWAFQGASRFIYLRMCITYSLKVLEKLSNGQTLIKYRTLDEEDLHSLEPTVEEKNLPW